MNTKEYYISEIDKLSEDMITKKHEYIDTEHKVCFNGFIAKLTGTVEYDEDIMCMENQIVDAICQEYDSIDTLSKINKIHESFANCEIGFNEAKRRFKMAIRLDGEIEQ